MGQRNLPVNVAGFLSTIKRPKNIAGLFLKKCKSADEKEKVIFPLSSAGSSVYFFGSWFFLVAMGESAG